MELLVLAVVIIAVALLQNYLYKHYAFSSLQYHCEFSKMQVREGDEIELVETISNKKLLPLPWLKAEISTSKWLEFSELQSVVTDKTRFVSSFFMMKSYRKVTRVWKVKCLKRGVFSIDRVILVATDLIGMQSFSQAAKVDATVTVYPREIDVPNEFISAQHLSGEIVVSRHLVTDPFYISGVREYTQRDPFNKIHWGATAKEKRLMVYHNDYTVSQSLAIFLNLQAREFITAGSLEEQKVEDAIRVCAWLLEDTVRVGMPVCLLVNGGTGRKQRETIVTSEFWGYEHVQSLLEILTRLQLDNSESFSSFLADHYGKISSTNLAIVTAYLSEDMLDFAKKNAWNGVQVKIYVTGPLPEELDLGDCEVYCLYEGNRKRSKNFTQKETA